VSGGDSKSETIEPPESFRGARFRSVDFGGADFREVDFTGVRVRGALLVDVDINALIKNVRINGVDVVPLVVAELDRLQPERVTLRSSTPDGVREAWRLIEARWEPTMRRLRDLPEDARQRRVDDEWSAVETLRHLVFVADSWFARTVAGEPAPFDPLGLPPTFLDPSSFMDVAPAASFADVAAARARRMERIRDYLAAVDEAELARRCAPNPEPGYPEPTTMPVVDCLHVLFDEEWEHHEFLVRDLEAL
jgi:uncharacterized damage-inducible protein DinB